jgi:hypothetical protein
MDLPEANESGLKELIRNGFQPGADSLTSRIPVGKSFRDMLAALQGPMIVEGIEQEWNEVE